MENELIYLDLFIDGPFMINMVALNYRKGSPTTMIYGPHELIGFILKVPCLTPILSVVDARFIYPEKSDQTFIVAIYIV